MPVRSNNPNEQAYQAETRPSRLQSLPPCLENRQCFCWDYYTQQCFNCLMPYNYIQPPPPWPDTELFKTLEDKWENIIRTSHEGIEGRHNVYKKWKINQNIIIINSVMKTYHELPKCVILHDISGLFGPMYNDVYLILIYIHHSRVYIY